MYDDIILSRLKERRLFYQNFHATFFMFLIRKCKISTAAVTRGAELLIIFKDLQTELDTMSWNDFKGIWNNEIKNIVHLKGNYYHVKV